MNTIKKVIPHKHRLINPKDQNHLQTLKVVTSPPIPLKKGSAVVDE